MSKKPSQAMLADIAALKSMEDPGHILHLELCSLQECQDCSFYAGSMDGGCCKGLVGAAMRHYQMYKGGHCDKKALTKRYATLADYLKRQLMSQVCKEPVTFLPPCKWAGGSGSCVWCTNQKCRTYFNGPCSKRCTEAEE